MCVPGDAEQCLFQLAWVPCVARGRQEDISAAVTLAAEGLGVAVLPAGDAGQSSALSVLPFADRSLVHEVQLAHRTGRSLGPPAAELLSVLTA